MINLEQAKVNPAEYFDSPAAVNAHDELTTEQKIEILESWRQEIQQRIVAEEENMASTEESFNEEEKLLHQIHEVLVEIRGPSDPMDKE